MNGCWSLKVLSTILTSLVATLNLVALLQKMLQDYLQGYDQARAASSELRRAMAERIMEHEAKLAKAVSALEEIAGNGNAAGRNPQLMADKARTTLAEIKGE